jgi:protein SCO1/2
VGPDLRGVTDRRERAWLERFIRRPDLVRGRNDPVAAALVAKFPGVRMPALGIAEADATDLIAYLQAETAQLNDVQSTQDTSAHSHHQH